MILFLVFDCILSCTLFIFSENHVFHCQSILSSRILFVIYSEGKFAFITVPSEEEGQKIIKAFDRRELRGRTIVVQIAFRNQKVEESGANENKVNH